MVEADPGANRGDRRPYTVVRTSEETGAVPDRCAGWAGRTGVAVTVVGPVEGEQLAAMVRSGDSAGLVIEVAAVRHDRAVAAAVRGAGVPVVAVTRDLPSDDPSVVEAACTTTIAGRGTSGFLWALGHVHALHAIPPQTVPYGDHPAHVGDLRLRPAAPGAPAVMLVHGGFWRHEWGRDLMDGLAVDLARRGYATWNIEYRRVGPTGGGWPQTRDDVVRAARALAELTAGAAGHASQTVLLGHSAGAQLALRAAAELRGDKRPALVVALSGLFDLAAAARDGVGWGSIEAFVGGDPADAPDAYRQAAPAAHLPLGVPLLLVHGDDDVHVPPTQSAAHHRRASAAGDVVDLRMAPGADHFAVIDPAAAAWSVAVSAIAQHVPGARTSE